MSLRAPPKKPSAAITALQGEAQRRRLTAYRLAKATGLRIHTIQRFMAGVGSPTIATVEAIAEALGMVIKAEPKRQSR
jgi:DNA-binding phage protein